MRQIAVQNFTQWRKAARDFLKAQVPPEEILWVSEAEQSLFEESPIYSHNMPSPSVPKAFLPLAKEVGYHRSLEKWSLLYRILWRLTRGERHLLNLAIDDDIRAAKKMAKEVSRDGHKMKAFVRFREVPNQKNTYIAWHEPSHLVVRRVAPFFARRFASMNWAILTPDESVHWDGEKLYYSEGVPRSAAPQEDAMEELWKTFYRNIFNPARIKIGMMKSEMPVKYWHTMPETALIPQMLEEADARIKKMMEAMPEEEEVKSER